MKGLGDVVDSLADLIIYGADRPPREAARCALECVAEHCQSMNLRVSSIRLRKIANFIESKDARELRKELVLAISLIADEFEHLHVGAISEEATYGHRMDEAVSKTKAALDELAAKLIPVIQDSVIPALEEMARAREMVELVGKPPKPCPDFVTHGEPPEK